MAEVFSLQDMYGAPVSSLSMNYEFDFLGKNTQLIGVNTISYPPIDDGLVEREVVEVEVEEDNGWGWGLNLFLGCLVTAACATVAVVAAPVTVTVAVVAGCAAVGAAAVTTYIAVTDYERGKARPWYEALGETVAGAVVGAFTGAIFVESYLAVGGGKALGSTFFGGGSQVLALAGVGTWEIEGGIEIAGVLEGVVGLGVTIDLIKKAKKTREGVNSQKNNGGRNFKIDKQKKGTPKNNQAQNKSFRDVVKKLGLNKDEQRQLHDAISHQNYSYQEILEEARYMFKK